MTLDRTLAPAISEITSLPLPPVARETLGNGAVLHILHGGAQPVIKLEIAFKAGKWYEPKPGVSFLTAKMLLEGTTQHTSKQIADTIAFYGATLECNNGYDRATLTLYCLSKHLPELLPLVLEILVAPSFPEHEFVLLKQRTLQNVQVERKKNSYLATEAFTKNIYGEQHPYRFGLTEEHLHAVTLEDVRNFHQKAYTATGTHIFLAGIFDNDLLETVKKSFAILHQEEPTGSKDAVPVPGSAYDIITIPDTLQSSIRVGSLWPDVHDPAYPKLLILNEVFGGYFGSRLMKNIREDKGYTYGIYSAVSPKEHSCLFYIATDVNAENTLNTLQEIEKETNALTQQAIPDEELHTVRNYMVGKLLNDLATPFDQIERYKALIFQNAPLDFYQNWLQIIQTISPDELQSLAQEYLTFEKLSVTVVGSKS